MEKWASVKKVGLRLRVNARIHSGLHMHVQPYTHEKHTYLHVERENFNRNFKIPVFNVCLSCIDQFYFWFLGIIILLKFLIGKNNYIFYCFTQWQSHTCINFSYFRPHHPLWSNWTLLPTSLFLLCVCSFPFAAHWVLGFLEHECKGLFGGQLTKLWNGAIFDRRLGGFLLIFVGGGVLSCKVVYYQRTVTVEYWPIKTPQIPFVVICVTVCNLKSFRGFWSRGSAGQKL